MMRRCVMSRARLQLLEEEDEDEDEEEEERSMVSLNKIKTNSMIPLFRGIPGYPRGVCRNSLCVCIMCV